MKFFMRLDFHSGMNSEDPQSHVGSVYGPYEDDKAVDEAITRLWPNDKEERFLVFDGRIAVVKSLNERLENEKLEHEKREPGNTENYIKNGENWKCKDCGVDTISVLVAHPVWVRGYAGGYGDYNHETVLYCPNCEKKPNPQGAPVYAD